MKRTLIALAGMALFAIAQPAIETPVLGHIQDDAGGWHAVYGTAGNFVLGPVTDEPPANAPTMANRVERRGAMVYIVAPNGGTVDILPPETQTALLVEDGVVYSTPKEIVVRRFRDKEIHLPAAGVTMLRRMSAEYVQATADRQLAIRVEPNREAVFVLPKPPDVAPRRKLPAVEAAPEIPWRTRQQ